MVTMPTPGLNTNLPQSHRLPRDEVAWLREGNAAFTPMLRPCPA